VSKKEERIGTDLKLRFDELGADVTVGSRNDLDIVEGEDNLAQAIIARLSTDEGELNDIGHADYGSRLHNVVGEINNEATRQRIKGVVRQCLAQEPRIKKVISINVFTVQKEPNRVNIEITILPIGSGVYLTVMYPFRLER
jgi:phage baseplate assembly protein W